MRCGSCGQQNREGARFCDTCGASLGTDAHHLTQRSTRDCISCGKSIDLGVYFTVCPHCGFNYRIEISPMRAGHMASKSNAALLYVLSAVVPAAGFVIGALLASEKNEESREIANGCLVLAALNIIVTPLLILRYLGAA